MRFLLIFIVILKLKIEKIVINFEIMTLYVIKKLKYYKLNIVNYRKKNHFKNNYQNYFLSIRHFQHKEQEIIDCVFYNIQKMTQLQIEAHGLPNELAFKIKYPDVPNITFNFRLDIKINKQSLKGQLSQVYTKSMYIPEKQIRIKPLEGNFIYKLQVDLITNNRTFKKNAYTFVPRELQNQQNQQNNEQIQRQYEIPQRIQAKQTFRQASMKFRPQKTIVKQELTDHFSISQDFMRMVGKSVGITNSKKLDKYILQGRKCRNTQQFLNSKKQFQNGNIKKTIQKHKMLLKGKLVFRDVYKQSEGQTFFKNDWFMGPFYSYDNNEKKLVKE